MSEGEPLNPYRPPLQSEPLPDSDGNRIPVLAAAYFTLLGWGSLALSGFTAYHTGNLHFDVAFIMWFSLANFLRKRSNKGRLFAILVFWIVLIISLLVVTHHINVVTFGPFTYPATSTMAYFLQAAYLIIFGLPGILLMTPRARQAFQTSH